jgi:hypothetical protein
VTSLVNLPLLGKRSGATRYESAQTESGLHPESISSYTTSAPYEPRPDRRYLLATIGHDLAV